MGTINWKTFTMEKNGVKLEVTWWQKDFTAKYKIDNAILKYGLHIPAMCPLVYNEERLKQKLEEEGIHSCFREAEDIIKTQEVFIEAAKARFSKTKLDGIKDEWFGDCWEIAKSIKVAHSKTTHILHHYLEELWKNS